MNYSILAVEGSLDQIFVTRCLEYLGYKIIKGKRNDIDLFFREYMIPESLAHLDFDKSLGIPYFLTDHKENYIAVYKGNGHQLVQNIKDMIKTSGGRYATEVYSFVIIVDADLELPDVKTSKISVELRDTFPQFPQKAGILTNSTPKVGTYVFPDNVRKGVIEHVLMKCAEVSHENKINAATEYVSQVENELKTGGHFKKEKAVLGSIACVLQPGYSLNISVGDENDRWICEKTVVGDELSVFTEFLKNTFGLNTP